MSLGLPYIRRRFEVCLHLLGARLKFVVTTLSDSLYKNEFLDFIDSLKIISAAKG